MSMLLSENVLYVRTVEASRKQPPKMERLSGRLREVVSCKNRTKRGLFSEDNLLHAMSELGYLLFNVVAKALRYSKYHSAHSANRD